MLLDIIRIVKDIEGSIPFAFEENLEMLSEGIGTVHFQGKVHVTGTIANINGMLALTAEASVKYNSLCDRCTASISDVLHVNINENIVEQVQTETVQNEERYVWSGHILDIGPIVSEVIIMQAPVYGLCKNDCRGICEQCGTNLNTGDCACGDKKPVDIRLAALESFFKSSDA